MDGYLETCARSRGHRRRVISSIWPNRGRFQAPFYAALTEPALGDLYLWLERKFPHTDDPNRKGGIPHWVGPREMVGNLRDGVLRHIVELGTDAGLKTLREIIAQRPDLTWLPLQLSKAEQIMRDQDLGAAYSEGDCRRWRLRNADAWFNRPRIFARYLWNRFRNTKPNSMANKRQLGSLWDRQADKSMRPVDENTLSDHVKQFLKRELVDSGIVLNREVEVGRVPGAPVGTRTDIKIDAIRHERKRRGLRRYRRGDRNQRVLEPQSALCDQDPASRRLSSAFGCAAWNLPGWMV